VCVCGSCVCVCVCVVGVCEREGERVCVCMCVCEWVSDGAWVGFWKKMSPSFQTLNHALSQSNKHRLYSCLFRHL